MPYLTRLQWRDRDAYQEALPHDRKAAESAFIVEDFEMHGAKG